MKKVYQRIVDPQRGDCYKCCIASILGLEYEDVPNFIEFGEDWLIKAIEFFKEHGYKYASEYLYNPNVIYLENPTINVYEDVSAYKPKTLSAIKPNYGIDDLFMASVYSPKYTNASENPIEHCHSVLCDIDFNIVFDPNPEYEKVINYPYSKLIGYNGIRGIDVIKPLK